MGARYIRDVPVEERRYGGGRMNCVRVITMPITHVNWMNMNRAA